MFKKQRSNLFYFNRGSLRYQYHDTTNFSILYCQHNYIHYIMVLKDIKTGFKMPFSSVFAYFIIIAPWCFRNYNEYRHFALSNIKGTTCFWNTSYYETKRLQLPIDTINAHFKEELVKMGWQPD